jgi:hypothetical protein
MPSSGIQNTTPLYLVLFQQTQENMFKTIKIIFSVLTPEDHMKVYQSATTLNLEGDAGNRSVAQTAST